MVVFWRNGFLERGNRGLEFYYQLESYDVECREFRIIVWKIEKVK